MEYDKHSDKCMFVSIYRFRFFVENPETYAYRLSNSSIYAYTEKLLSYAKKY